MADINKVSFKNTTAPGIKYYVTYTSKRNSVTSVSYTFNITPSLINSGGYLLTGFKLDCTITVGGKSGTVNLKANTDKWYTSDGNQTTKSITITCNSSVGGETQAVKFVVADNGSLGNNWGEISNSSYTVSSPAQTNKLTVVYNANGGTQATGNKYPLPYTDGPYPYGQNYNGSSGLWDIGTFGLTKTGYFANSWNTNSSGTGNTISQSASHTTQSLATAAGKDLSSGSVTVNFYPKWQAKKLTVNFYQNDGSSTYQTKTYTYGTSGQTFIVAKSRDGYAQSGWSLDSNATSATWTPTNSVANSWIETQVGSGNIASKTISLYAVWTEDIPDCDIKYDFWNVSGISISSSTYKFSTDGYNRICLISTGEEYKTTIANDGTKTYKVLAPSAFGVSRKGYNFTSYTSSQSVTGIKAGSSYTAKQLLNGSDSTYTYLSGKTWTPITYTITYNLNGGVLEYSNPSSYTIETSTFTLNNPTREGYVFKGWSTSSSATSGNTNYQISKGSTGNLVLYAIWAEATYVKLTFKAQTPSHINYFIATGYSTCYSDSAYEFAVGETITVKPHFKQGFTGGTWKNSSGTTIDSDKTLNITVPNIATIYTFVSNEASYRITYKRHDGTLTYSDYFNKDTRIEIKSPATRTGYTFKGWYCADIAFTYQPGDKVQAFELLTTTQVADGETELLLEETWEKDSSSSSSSYTLYVSKDSGIGHINPSTTQKSSSKLTVHCSGKCKPGFFEKGWKKSLTGIINLTAPTDPNNWTGLDYTITMSSTTEYWKAFTGEKKCQICFHDLRKNTSIAKKMIITSRTFESLEFTKQYFNDENGYTPSDRIGYTFLGWEWDNPTTGETEFFEKDAQITNLMLETFSPDSNWQTYKNRKTTLGIGSAVDKNNDDLPQIHLYAKWKCTGTIHISVNNLWKEAIPYIYTNGQWKQIIPYIHSDGAWLPVGGDEPSS